MQVGQDARHDVGQRVEHALRVVLVEAAVVREHVLEGRRADGFRARLHRHQLLDEKRVVSVW
jgi:hypothetical protein